MPTPPFAAISEAEEVMPAAEVLERDEQSFFEELQTTLDQHLLRERVPDLDVRPPGLGLLVVQRWQDRVCRRARSSSRGGRPGCLLRWPGADEVLGADEPDAHRVTSGFEYAPANSDLTPDRRHANGVPVAPYTAHHFPNR